MMKMHGLGDGPYWLITYGYFLVLSIIYMLCFVVFGSAIGKLQWLIGLKNFEIEIIKGYLCFRAFQNPFKLTSLLQG